MCRCRPAFKGVVALTAIEVIITGATVEIIVSGTAFDRIVARTTRSVSSPASPYSVSSLSSAATATCPSILTSENLMKASSLELVFLFRKPAERDFMIARAEVAHINS